MSKYRSVIVLPSVQFVLAIALMQWGYWATKHRPGKFDTVYVSTPSLVCDGLDAPASVLRMLYRMFLERLWPEGDLWSVAGFGAEDLIFLAGVVVLWYLVGRSMDRRVFGTLPAMETGATRYKAWQVAQMLWGGMVLWTLLQEFNQAPLEQTLSGKILAGLGNYNNGLGCILRDLGFLGWSLVLLVRPAISLVRRHAGNRGQTHRYTYFLSLAGGVKRSGAFHEGKKQV
jgi:hypothetical protein